QAGNARITRLYFNSQGNKCGVADGEGFLSLWQVNQTSSNPKPYLVWKLAGHGLMHSFSNEHAKQSIFRNIGAGVMKVETRPGNRIFTCGADGTLKMRVLPDRYNIASSIVDIL
ncbi:hypothetical protein XENOCAPTIV_024931, partial [Xenoophorus captivus]